MELLGTRKSERGMLDGIKSRLGFSDGNDRRYDRNSRDVAGDGYEDYDDYGDDYGDYGEDYEEFADYGPDYDESAPVNSYEPYAPVTTRSADASVASRRSSRTGASMPKLVSIDDVRARTSLSDSQSRSSSASSTSLASSVSSRRFAERTMVDSSLPPSLTPEGAQAAAAAATAASSARRDRSAGLNSLFEPTDTPSGGSSSGGRSASTANGQGSSAVRSGTMGSSAAGTGSSAASATSAQGGFDPYEAYAGGKAASFSSSRACTVLKPASYGEVERIAKILKAGDAVVLALRNTPDSLSKRILDFSFGVSSALDANVECAGDGVFVIARGAALTDAERANLRNQGVL